MQRKSAYLPTYQNWPQMTGFLLYGSARPEFLGAIRTSALAVEFSASGQSAWWALFRQDGTLVDKDRYATFGTANSYGLVQVRNQKNETEHHNTGLPPRHNNMSGISG
jgi:hypothetical protein